MRIEEQHTNRQNMPAENLNTINDQEKDDGERSNHAIQSFIQNTIDSNTNIYNRKTKIKQRRKSQGYSGQKSQRQPFSNSFKGTNSRSINPVSSIMSGEGKQQNGGLNIDLKELG